MTTRRIEIVDVTEPRYGYDYGRAYGMTRDSDSDSDSDGPNPDFVGSGGPPRRPRNLPKLPNNTELAFDEKHSELLSALLPALNKYNCLLFTSNKPPRSPWVRAFCDLYHPAGPWGSSKFSNAPDTTSKRKYNFKSYQIPTLYKQLKKYKSDSEVHVALKTALEDYFSKEAWYKEFLQGCEKVAAVEVNKPAAERAAIPTGAAIPTVETGIVAAAAAAAAAAQGQTTAAAEIADMVGGEKNASANRPSSRRRKRESNLSERPRTRARRHQQQEKKTPTEDTANELPAVSRTPVTPDSSGHRTKEVLEQKRAELAKLLSRRRGNATPTKDLLSGRIQTQIDKLDGELLEMILA